MRVPTNILTQQHTPMGAHLPGCTSTQDTPGSVFKSPLCSLCEERRECQCVCVLGVGGFGLAGSLRGPSARVRTHEMLHGAGPLPAGGGASVLLRAFAK